ncbi:MAG: four-carbon acid sugar kinase family protein [Mangrovibacterium sp.]
MIAVIADDFTGAAEVAGLAFDSGLQVIVGSEVSAELKSGIDVFVAVADTRSMQRADAVNHIEKLTKDIMALKPELIYKKVDSVLRGYVHDELQAQMQSEGKKKVAILAGNPHFNRLIIDGVFYVDGVKLSETSFAHDLEFPATSSNVVDLLNAKDCQVVQVGEDLPSEGFLMGNVDSVESLSQWAKVLDDTWVLAGGAAFFECVLACKFPEAKSQNILPRKLYKKGRKTIAFLGSNFPKANGFEADLQRLALLHFNLDEAFFLEYSPELVEQKAKEIVALSLSNSTVIVSSIFSITNHKLLTPASIRNITGELAAAILSYQDFDELFIEGGATAYAIIQKLGVKLLKPELALAPGIIQLKDLNANRTIITKPGSYQWPAYVVPKTKNQKQTNL